MEILKIIISIPLGWVTLAFGIGVLRDLLDGKIVNAIKSTIIAGVSATVLLVLWSQ